MWYVLERDYMEELGVDVTIKEMDLQEIQQEDTGWIDLALERGKCGVLVNMEIISWVL